MKASKKQKLPGWKQYGRVMVFIDNANIIHSLSTLGWKLDHRKTKEYFGKYSDFNGATILKGDLDIEIAIDMFESLDKFDTAVLLSGDSDFAPLLDWLHTKGKKAVVISTRPHISRELARASDKFIDLNRFRKFWKLKRG